LCSEKTIFELFIHEPTEDQLSSDRVLDRAIFLLNNTCRQNQTNYGITAILIVPP